MSFNRTQSRAVIGLLTGHNNLRIHLHILGLTVSPLCRKCGVKEETSAHYYYYYYYYYYRYSALGPVWAETRTQSGGWYGSGTLHAGRVLRCSLPLLSPAFRRSQFRHQVPPRPPRRERY